MLLVRTYLDRSALHGIGVFAAELISATTVVWRFTPGFDLDLKPGRHAHAATEKQRPKVQGKLCKIGEGQKLSPFRFR